MIIEKVISGPFCVGKFDDDLVAYTKVKSDEQIVFGPEHIIQLWEDQEKK